MKNNFREFEELVFFDLWIPDSGFRFPDSGFWLLGLPAKIHCSKIFHQAKFQANTKYVISSAHNFMKQLTFSVLILVYSGDTDANLSYGVYRLMRVRAAKNPLQPS